MANRKIKFVEKTKKSIFSRSYIIILLLILQCIFLGVFFFKLSGYIHYFYGINLILSFILAVYIVNRQENPEFKIAWLTFMCLLPVFGILYYLYVELNPKWKRNAIKVQTLIQESAYLLHANETVVRAMEHDAPERIGLMNYLQTSGPYPVYHQAEVEYYNDGEKSFEAIKIALRKAKSYIFMEYFVVSPGRLLDELIGILKERADSGVEIRFMYDGFCHARSLPDDFPNQLKELGIQVRVFEPLSPFLSTDQNNRDHRKITIVDGEVAFTGGVNLADEYVNFVHPYGHWKDVSVKVSGGAVKTFVVLFLQNWHLDGDKRKDVWEDYIADGTDKPQENQSASEKGFVAPYADSPNIPNDIGETVYIDILNQANDYVWIMSPYLILGSVMLKAITYAAKRGVDVKIIIPHIPDKKIPFLIARSFYPELLQAGIKLYEYTPGFIHAKVFVSDDRVATVGSFNMDYRSFYLHYEVGALFTHGTVLKDISNDYENTRQESQEIKLSDYKSFSFTSRTIGKVLRLLGPLM